MKPKTRTRQGGSNLFADLKLPDADELHAKAQIAYKICGILEERKLTQKAAAQLLGIDQPKVSALLHGKLEGFSSDRLFRFLNALDRDIEIVIKPVRKRNGLPGIRVLALA
jgi:predicted XRE-type DNA-binding protein